MLDIMIHYDQLFKDSKDSQVYHNKFEKPSGLWGWHALFPKREPIAIIYEPFHFST
jgi:hypothetical protein